MLKVGHHCPKWATLQMLFISLYILAVNYQLFFNESSLLPPPYQPHFRSLSYQFFHKTKNANLLEKMENSLLTEN